jgi:hypothetical protein
VQETRLPDLRASERAAHPFICLQTMWRSCGTYIWNKFREDRRFCAYYEPCHEELIALSAHRGLAMGLREILRHSDVRGDYFSEFPIDLTGRARHFQKRFSFDDYYMPCGVEDVGLAHYLGHLLTRARAQRRTPVVKLCRWSLRTAWLVRNFQARIFCVVRDPDAIFRSYWSYGGTRSYFFMASVLIVARNRDTPLFAEIADAARIPPIHADTCREELVQAVAVTQQCSVQTLRDIVLFFWALHLKQNMQPSAIIGDVDLMATDIDYRRAIEQRVGQVVGQAMSFGDIRHPRVLPAPGVVVSPRGAGIARRALGRLPPIEAETPQLSENSARVFETLAP